MAYDKMHQLVTPLRMGIGFELIFFLRYTVPDCDRKKVDSFAWLTALKFLNKSVWLGCLLALTLDTKDTKGYFHGFLT